MLPPLPQIVINYTELIPYFLLALGICLLVMPFIGKMAFRIGALDMPAYLRTNRNERGLETRINPKITPRSGGIAMVIAILATLIITGAMGYLTWGIILGIIILTIAGILDDTYELSGNVMIIFQFIAAALVILSGISIANIQVAGIAIDFSTFTSTFSIGSFIYNFVFPGDLITLVWIVGIMNFINWVGGIDALHGSVTAIADVALLLIAMRTGNFPLAAIITVHLGGVLGVLFYNYPPSKIFYGGVGEFINGFLLAVFAILGGSKQATSIIILGLPILDAVWVIFLRLKSAGRAGLRNPVRVVFTSDRNHLHHRLLDVGYNWKTVVLIETVMMSLLATIAFYFSGFSDEFILLGAAFTMLLIIFAIIAIARRREQRRKELAQVKESRMPKIEVKMANPPKQNIEDKYKY